METPSSTRRITRSQAKAASSTTNFSRKNEESAQRTAKQERNVLIDIKNDSPIVGVASGNLNSTTPISSVSKRYTKTPGSGEALLRGQVKNLLQKVEEEAEISKFLSLGSGPVRNGRIKGFLNSPGGLLAPTPANTPQVLNFGSAVDGFEFLGSVVESPIEDQLTVSKIMSGNADGKQHLESAESEKDLISRTLFLDFSDKSDTSSDCSSVVTYQGVESQSLRKSPLKDDDDATIWSVQVNVSTRDEDEEDDDAEEVVLDDLAQADDDDDDSDESAKDVEASIDLLQLDELCQGIQNISVECDMGKHVRFVYDSDDELVEEHEVLHLKGLPTPQGKHLHFKDAEE